MPNIRHLALGFLSLGVSSLTFAAQPPIMAAPPIVALMPLVSDNPDYFEFTPEQQLGLDEIRQGVGQRAQTLEQRIVDIRRLLREEIMNYTAEPQAISDLRDELFKTEQLRLQMSLDCAAILRKTLTAEQWETLLELAQNP